MVNWNNGIVRNRDKPLGINTASKRNIGQISEKRAGKGETMTTLIKLYRIETPEPKFQPKQEEKEERLTTARQQPEPGDHAESFLSSIVNHVLGVFDWASGPAMTEQERMRPDPIEVEQARRVGPALF